MKPIDLQTVKYGTLKAICNHCKNDLTDVNNMTYLKKRWGGAKYWDELCKCGNCQKKFFLRHEIFDAKGHIYSYVFTEDINDIKYNWMDNLNKPQRISVAKHLDKCKECQERRFKQTSTDIQLKGFFRDLRKK